MKFMPERIISLAFVGENDALVEKTANDFKAKLAKLFADNVMPAGVEVAEIAVINPEDEEG
jgi:hypothetical protein